MPYLNVQHGLALLHEVVARGINIHLKRKCGAIRDRALFETTNDDETL